MPKYVAAIDQGTTSTRCILFDHGGNIVAADQREHEQIYPNPAGWNTTVSRSGNAPAGGTQCIGKIRSGRGRHCSHRHHQSARNQPGLGTRNRAAGIQCHRLAGYPTDTICHELAKDGGQDACA